jgi:hypothetical protein
VNIALPLDVHQTGWDVNPNIATLVASAITSANNSGGCRALTAKAASAMYPCHACHFCQCYGPLQNVNKSEIDGSWLKLMGIVATQLIVVTGRFSKETVRVLPGLTTTTDELTRLIDPLCMVSSAVPTPSTLRVMLHAPSGTLTAGGDKLAERVAPWQVPAKLDKPWLTVNVADPLLMVIVPLLVSMTRTAVLSVPGIVAKRRLAMPVQLTGAAMNTPLLRPMKFGDWQFNTPLPPGIVPLQARA